MLCHCSARLTIQRELAICRESSSQFCRPHGSLAHRQRVSTILHIEDAQRAQRSPDKAYKPDIIDKYSQYSSGVYAPMQREGRFPDTRPVEQRIDTRPFQPSTYAELLDLEASLPQRQLMAKVQVHCHCF